MAKPNEILIVRGSTLTMLLRWETEPRISKAISAISLASGWPRLTVTGHNLPDGWEAGVSRVTGMKQINSGDKAYRCTVIDPNTLELNGITPADEQGKEWPAYISGGWLEYATPVDMTGYTARMKIRDKEGGILLASTEVADAPLNIIAITIDNAAKTILLRISEPNTKAITFKGGVTDLEMVSPTGIVTKLKLSKGLDDTPDPVRVTGEITT